ncbi:MAG TPA: aryl-sulfate sulfotransferase [Candidatus Bathyarchaeia archaeon]|nr:aryl-sulfate sulfotransferase [Candidatus Bathyarchaeia archaeon]
MYSAKRRNSATLLQIALIIAFALVTSYTAPVNAFPSVKQSAESFKVPVTIKTYGNAWDGYLAFGLWHFAYGATNFSLTPDSYLAVMTTKGQLVDLRTAGGINPGASIQGFAGVTNPIYAPVKYIGQNTIMFQGEPDTSTHFWNLKTNETTDFSGLYGHHDTIFNPATGTFLMLESYVRQIDGRNVLMDTIVEQDEMGNTLWTWDTYSGGHFSLKDECLCNATTLVNGQEVIDLTHANSLQWNFQTNMIYMNMRALDTFCKINKTTNQTVWCLGRRGDFMLLGPDGKQVPSLWYHAHDVREVQPDVFTMFDDDYDNTTNATNPCPATFEETNAHSRILEITVNEQNMTAWTSWSWEAPREDWTPYWGSVDILPNGDWLADFGSQSHYLPGSGIGSPLPNSTGAVFVEVNQKGEVVRTYTFAYGWGIYRVVPIPLQTTNNYDGATHVGDFNIILSTVNDIGGPTAIYYRINGGPVKSVATDGQPFITTTGTNNTLEYWSVDSNGIEQLPHNMLTGISLAFLFGASNSSIILMVAVAIIVAISVVVIMRRRKRASSKV